MGFYDEYERKKYRNDYRKKIVICGFDEIEKKSIPLYEAAGKYYDGDYFTPYRKAPIFEFVDSLQNALKKQGLILVLKVEKDFNPIEFDKKYRQKLNYWYIYYYNENFKPPYEHNKFNNMYKIDEQWLYGSWIEDLTYEIDKYFAEHPKLKLHPKKEKLLDDIHFFVKKRKEVSSKEISCEFNVSIRNVQRYMNDINLIYNDIGYDYSLNIWYICQ